MEGAVIQELADRFAKPEALSESVIARPKDWVLVDPNEVIKPAPRAAAINVATLGAVRDYLVANRDTLDLSTLIVHVETPNRVTVGGALRERSRDRELFITAEAPDMTEGFLGRFHSSEDFNIGLQVRFVDVDQRADLLTMVSSVKVEQSQEAIDNGVSQTLEARGGAVLKSHVKLPNPVTLTPFRTFRDILQPSSPFVLRANTDRGELPELALFEADGGTWKLTAIERVRDWLSIELKDLSPAVAILA